MEILFILFLVFLLGYAIGRPSTGGVVTMIVREQKHGETTRFAIEAYIGQKNALGNIDFVGQDNIVAKVVGQKSPPKFEIESSLPEDRLEEIMRNFNSIIVSKNL